MHDFFTVIRCLSYTFVTLSDHSGAFWQNLTVTVYVSDFQATPGLTLTDSFYPCKLKIAVVE